MQLSAQSWAARSARASIVNSTHSSISEGRASFRSFSSEDEREDLMALAFELRVDYDDIVDAMDRGEARALAGRACAEGAA